MEKGRAVAPADRGTTGLAPLLLPCPKPATQRGKYHGQGHAAGAEGGPRQTAGKEPGPSVLHP